MKYPLKFRELLEIELKDIDAPDYAWITYAVCGMTPEACGWQGWILESLFKHTGGPTPAGAFDKLLPVDNPDQRCPRCRQRLFRTSATIRFVPSLDQTPAHGKPGVDYGVSSLEYD